LLFVFFGGGSFWRVSNAAGSLDLDARLLPCDF
jgi:hypothetical protein